MVDVVQRERARPSPSREIVPLSSRLDTSREKPTGCGIKPLNGRGGLHKPVVICVKQTAVWSNQIAAIKKKFRCGKRKEKKMGLEIFEPES